MPEIPLSEQASQILNKVRVATDPSRLRFYQTRAEQLPNLEEADLIIEEIVKRTRELMEGAPENAIGSQANIGRATAEQPQRVEAKILDPNNLWRSFREINLSVEDLPLTEKADSPEEIAAMERLLLKIGIENAVNYLWKNPTEKTVAGEAKFRDFPIQLSPARITLSDLVEKHPWADDERGKAFKESLDQTVKVLTGATEWSTVIEKVGPFEAVKEFLREHVLSGPDWAALSRLPAMGYREKYVANLPQQAPSDGPTESAPSATADNGMSETDVENNDQVLEYINQEPGLGLLIFEATGIYANYNQLYVYANKEERQAISGQVDQDFATGRLKYPKEEQLKLLVTELENEARRKRGAVKMASDFTPPTIDLGTSSLTNNLTLRDLAVMYQRSGLNYAVFKQSYKNGIAENAVRQFEDKRQKSYGMFPLSEYGLLTSSIEGQTAQEFTNKRRQIAIRIGCYALGLGTYIPRINPDRKNAGKLREDTVNERGEKVSTYRDLTDEEIRAAFEAGKAGEMIGFSTYICTGSQLWDDDITVKSQLTAARLAITGPYRANYASSLREGMYVDGYRVVEQLVPDPLKYFGCNGQRLQRLLLDRDKIKEVNWELLGTKSNGLVKMWIEIYEFAVNLYPALSFGIQAATQKGLLDIANVVAPETLFSAVEELRFDEGAVQKLKEFVDKQIGYWLDRLRCEKADIDAKGSVYDPEIWQPVGSTGLYSPINWMFNLSQDDYNRIVSKIESSVDKKTTFKREFGKVILSIMLIESLMRQFRTKINLPDRVALQRIFVGEIGIGAQRRYDISSASALTPPDSTIFAYTEDELAGIFDTAQMSTQGKWSLFVKQLSGIKG